MKILIIEDKVETLNFLVQLLKKNNFNVKSANSLKKAREILVSDDFDLIILDRTFPNESDGLELCAELREKQKDVLIMVLSAQTGAIARASGLKKGADDYLEKPYNLNEFIARVNALLRRCERKFSSDKVGPFEVDEQRRQIFLDGKQVPLKLKEYQILLMLLKNPNRIITESEMLNNIWDTNKLFSKSNTINVHLAHIRRKLGDAKKFIKTIHGSGFIFEFSGTKES